MSAKKKAVITLPIKSQVHPARVRFGATETLSFTDPRTKKDVTMKHLVIPEPLGTIKAVGPLTLLWRNQQEKALIDLVEALLPFTVKDADPTVSLLAEECVTKCLEADRKDKAYYQEVEMKRRTKKQPSLGDIEYSARYLEAKKDGGRG